MAVYQKYRTPSIVQRHQLRVAAVGKFVAGRIPGIQEETVVLTGLFHDMGNILKMDLSPKAPLLSLMAPDTRDTLLSVQAEYRQIYGHDEHAASISIGREIGLSATVLAMIDNMRFSKTEWILERAPIEMKIAKYADLRVAPSGIVPLRERLDEAALRYQGKSYDTGDPYDLEVLRRTEGYCFAIERIVCEKAGIDPSVINEESVASIIDGLGEYYV